MVSPFARASSSALSQRSAILSGSIVMASSALCQIKPFVDARRNHTRLFAICQALNHFWSKLVLVFSGFVIDLPALRRNRSPHSGEVFILSAFVIVVKELADSICPFCKIHCLFPSDFLQMKLLWIFSFE